MKKIGKILIALICVFALSTKVKAIYNGSASGGKGNSAGANADCKGKKNCNYDNKNVGPILKAQLFYIDNGKYTPMSDTYYYYSSSANVALIKKYINDNHQDEALKDNPSAGYQHLVPLLTVDLSGWKKGNFDYEPARKQLLAYFGNDNNDDLTNLSNTNLRNFLYNVFGVSNNTDLGIAMSRESQVANPEAAALYGYRIIIEPVVTYQNATWNNGHNGNATPHEMATYLRGGASINSCHFPFSSAKKCSNTPSTALRQTVAFYTDFKDVGIESRSYDSCKSISPNDLTDTVGCAMNIVDVGKKLQPHYCYDKTVTGNVECKNVDSENEGDFTETYTRRECTAKEAEANTNSAYGKLVGTSGNCKLYAKESGHVILPGGISERNSVYNINNSSYFAWPAKKGNVGMHAQITDTVEYRIVNTAGNGDCTPAEINTLVETAKAKIKSGTFQLKLSGGDFNPINGQLLDPANQEEIIPTVAITFNGNVSNAFVFKKSSYMQINEATNRIYNRQLNKVFSRKTVQSTEEKDRGEGVVSLAINNVKYDESKEYKLDLTDLKFGIDGGTFSVKEYSCKLKTQRQHCECPPGKLSKSLDEFVNNGYTCAQAKNKAEETGYCEAYCETPDGKKINTTTCVMNEIKKGTDEASAIAKCSDAEPQCRKTCKTAKDTYIPEKDYNLCISDYHKKYPSLTTTELQEKCDDKLCGCVVNGETPDSYEKCIDDGGSRYYCTFAYCDKQNVCKQCLYCTVGCTWTEQKLSNGQVAVVKKCDNGDPEESDCGHRVLTNQSCVQGKVGSSIVTALNKGTLTVSDLDNYIYECGSSSNNLIDNVVFRLIDLDNPFPGSDGTQRFAGANFDSDETIRKVITEARGAKGDDLYKKTPLYTITLTPTQAKKVREYNKQHPLSDFNLTCADGTNYCYSEFLHNSDFITISTDTLKSACVNIKKNDANSFLKCYESNN